MSSFPRASAPLRLATASLALLFSLQAAAVEAPSSCEKYLADPAVRRQLSLEYARKTGAIAKDETLTERKEIDDLVLDAGKGAIAVSLILSTLTLIKFRFKVAVAAIGTAGAGVAAYAYGSSDMPRTLSHEEHACIEKEVHRQIAQERHLGQLPQAKDTMSKDAHHPDHSAKKLTRSVEKTSATPDFKTSVLSAYD